MPNARAGLVYGWHAAASVLGAGGGGTYDRQRGFTGNAGITRNGAGDYTLTLSDAIDTTPAQHMLIGSTADGAAAAIDAVIATATTIRCRTSAGAQVATDMRFAVLVWDFGPN